jgi:hypothetical protein
MSPDVKKELDHLGGEIIRAASQADAAALSILIENQKRFVDLHREEMNEAAVLTLGAVLEKALFSAKIRRAQVLDTIQANQRSLGVVQAYQTARLS